MRRLLDLRIVRWELKTLYIVVAWIVGFVVAGLLRSLGSPTVVLESANALTTFVPFALAVRISPPPGRAGRAAPGVVAHDGVAHAEPPTRDPVRRARRRVASLGVGAPPGRGVPGAPAAGPGRCRGHPSVRRTAVRAVSRSCT